MRAEDFERLGIYDPEAPEAEDRLRLIEYLTELGATEEELLEAHRTNNAGGLALSLVFRGSSELITFEETAKRAGLSTEEAARFVRALGFPDPRASDRLQAVTTAEHLSTVLVGGRDLLGPDATLALARVMGATMYKLAQTLVGAMRTNFESPRLNQGVPYSEVMKSYVELARELLPLFMEALETIFKDHLVAVASGTWSLDEEGSTNRVDLLVGFVDMVGFSSLSRGITSGSLAQLVVRFEDLASEAVAVHGGRIVKMVGDGAMFVCPDPENGCRLALDLIERFDRDDSLPQVHVGMAFGSVVDLHGDYFGEAVNVGARLHELAPASKVLVSESVADLVRQQFKLEDVSVWLGRTDVEGPVWELRTRSD